MTTILPQQQAATWQEANQRCLTAALAQVRAALERHVSRPQGEARQPGDGADRQALQEAGGPMPAPSALNTLCAHFGLSPFERDLLLLCAGVELDGSFPALCARAQEDPRKAYPTLSLALAALPEPHWSALAPLSPLRRWRLIELGSGDSLVTTLLRIDERVLHFLAGVSYLDDRLHGLVAPVPVPQGLPESQRAIVYQITGGWPQRPEGGRLPVVHLAGSGSGEERAIAASACAAVGLRLHALRAADIPEAAAERDALARLWEREAILLESALLLERDPAETPGAHRAALAFAEQMAGMLLVTGHDPLTLRGRPILRLHVARPTPAEQRQAWRAALGPLAGEREAEIDVVVSHFSLSPSAMQAAAAQVRASAASPNGGGPGPTLWEACRVQARTRLDDLAQRIESAAAWEDLVLPAPQLQTLREIAAQVRQRATVHERWGFATKGSRGLGISALFAGASGTGKTLAAEIIANELRLDLYRIDLSSVVSKYIGETEKNLRRVFDTAEESGAILLFDEADALFGKRSEVKDSHDRYANIEISYLLQRMEAYRGLAILTTNMKHVLDPAFLRRIRFLVAFPFPDTPQRAAIWRRAFPPETPTQGLDVHKLARLNVSGGNIRNIALHAAFLAATAGTPVQMGHLLRAARLECAKLERPLTDAEIGGWT